MRLLDQPQVSVVAGMTLMIGLAPVTPGPHIREKLKLLATGDLRRGIDVFDLGLHGAPWLLLLVKLGRLAARGLGR